MTVAAFQGIDVTQLLVSGMKLAQDNHRIIANNIANADTPNYNPLRLDFEATLRRELEGSGRFSLRKTRAQHLDSQRFRPETGHLTFLAKNDDNKVDIEEEMAELSKNTGRYTTYGSMVTKKFQMATNMLANAR